MKFLNLCLLGFFVGSVSLLSLDAAVVPLVNHGDSWHYRKGTNAPQTNWKTAADAVLDATWLVGNGGIGYANNATETNMLGTLVQDMLSKYTTVYMRRAFQVSSVPDATLRLTLAMDWDDGFIAWLDGNYLTNFNAAAAPNEPNFNAVASNSHESNHGDSSPQPVVTFDLGAVGARLGVGTHVFALLGLNQTLASSDFIQIADLTLTTNAVPPTNCVGGAIAANTTWRASDSPIQVCSSLTINNGVTLTIEPGTTVQLGAGVNITVANGGRILAEGTSNAPIRFSHAGASGNWGSVIINGALGSPETRITHASFDSNVSDVNVPCIEVNAGAAYLDHLIFGNPGAPYIHVDGASFTISDCYFPPATVAFEPCHGTRGVRRDGHGLFLRNFFGKAIGYSDVVDFTGGNRPNPIVYFIDNVVSGGDDDGFDLDGTDAWVEGNIFLHLHKNRGTPDSSSAVSGGNNTFGAGDPGGTGTETSEITVIGNIVYDCDQMADAKQGNFFTFFNNTVVHQSHQGGIDTDGAVVILADTGTVEGAGMYLEGNIVFDAEKLTRNVTAAIVTFTNNLLPYVWAGPGGGNVTNNPLLKHVPTLAETAFTNWAGAQVLRDWFSLLPGSPGLGTGPNGLDQGAVVPPGASISGEPSGITSQTGATLRVGVRRSGSGIPVDGFPLGTGYTHYRWRLDTNAWSAEIPIANSINVSGLADGSHYVEVIGKTDGGLYQNDPLLGSDGVITRSSTWTVQTFGPLHIDSATYTGGGVTLSFVAQAGHTYSVLARDALDAAHPWVRLSNVAAPDSTGSLTVTDATATGATRFYEIVTPALP